MSGQKNVVIVDAYSPTRRLAPEFHKAGYQVVRVQSTPEPPLAYRGNFDLSPYVANIVHTGDLDATVAAVAALDPEAIVAGGEIGVEFADTLSAMMGLLGNGTALSAARRDKYLQMEAIRAAGLRATRQLLVTDAAQLADWHRQVGGRLVVKPVRSAAGDGVSFCDSPETSVAAYEATLGALNCFSMPNEAVIAQEYLVGGEYVVDTVSRDGQHHVTDIWKYEKITANGITDLTNGLRLMPRHGDGQDAVVPYAFEVLDALGIAYGAAHLEIKLTPDGPCLVEAAARMAGLDMPFYAQQCIGDAQLEWIVDAYVRPDRFAERWKDDYELQRYWVSAMTVAPFGGTLRSYPYQSRLDGLETLQDIRPLVGPGGILRRTIDDLTCPLIINLAGPVEDLVQRDFRTICYLDGPAFYDVDGDRS